MGSKSSRPDSLRCHEPVTHQSTYGISLLSVNTQDRLNMSNQNKKRDFMGRRKYFVLTRGGVCVGHGVVCGRVPRPPVR